MAGADQAIAAVERLRRGLEQPAELEAAYARQLLAAAQARARSRPTPQAPMVAAAFTVDNGLVRGPQVGDLAEITMGAEFGSTVYRQFHRRHPRGSWLFPAADDPALEQVAETWIEELV